MKIGKVCNVRCRRHGLLRKSCGNLRSVKVISQFSRAGCTRNVCAVIYNIRSRLKSYLLIVVGKGCRYVVCSSRSGCKRSVSARRNRIVCCGKFCALNFRSGRPGRTCGPGGSGRSGRTCCARCSGFACCAGRTCGSGCARCSRFACRSGRSCGSGCSCGTCKSRKSGYSGRPGRTCRSGCPRRSGRSCRPCYSAGGPRRPGRSDRSSRSRRTY